MGKGTTTISIGLVAFLAFLMIFGREEAAYEAAYEAKHSSANGRILPTMNPADYKWEVAPQIIYKGDRYFGKGGSCGIVTDEYTEVARIAGIVPSTKSPVRELNSNDGEVGQIVYKKNGDEERIFICLGDEQELYGYEVKWK